MVLEYGANANVRSEADSDTPMHKAVREGHMPLVTLLIKHRADLSVSPAPLCAAKPARGVMCHVSPGYGSQESVLPHCQLTCARVCKQDVGASMRTSAHCLVAPNSCQQMLTYFIDVATAEHASCRRGQE